MAQKIRLYLCSLSGKGAHLKLASRIIIWSLKIRRYPPPYFLRGMSLGGVSVELWGFVARGGGRYRDKARGLHHDRDRVASSRDIAQLEVIHTP